MNEEPWFRRHPILATIILFIVVLLIFGGGSLSGNHPRGNDTPLNQPEYQDPAYGPQGEGN